jgi:hypothetical protein
MGVVTEARDRRPNGSRERSRAFLPEPRSAQSLLRVPPNDAFSHSQPDRESDGAKGASAADAGAAVGRQRARANIIRTDTARCRDAARRWRARTKSAEAYVKTQHTNQDLSRTRIRNRFRTSSRHLPPFPGTFLLGPCSGILSTASQNLPALSCSGKVLGRCRVPRPFTTLSKFARLVSRRRRARRKNLLTFLTRNWVRRRHTSLRGSNQVFPKVVSLSRRSSACRARPRGREAP